MTKTLRSAAASSRTTTRAAPRRAAAAAAAAAARVPGSRARTGAVKVQAFSLQETERLPTAPREVLRELASVGDDTYNRALRLHDGVAEQPRVQARLVLVLGQLMSACSLDSRDLQLILLRHAQVFGYNPEDIAEVLDFLQQDLGLEGQQLKAVMTRFPQVFSYSVKAHLRPQLAYLESLGVPHDQLRDYVVARPLLLGEGIETVIKFLRSCGVPRRQMGQLLRTFPIDYCCRFVVPGVGQLHLKDGQ